MSELINHLTAYGADMRATLERFVGEETLYDRCFRMFLNAPSFIELGEALQQKNYTAAFNVAHTLKGTSGNLQLTPLYHRICEIVEPLRHQDYSNLEAQYQAILSAKKEVDELQLFV